MMASTEWKPCGGEKWLDFGYILKVELKGSFDGLTVGCRDRDGTKGDFKIPFQLTYCAKSIV